jgi:hypothetical protein
VNIFSALRSGDTIYKLQSLINERQSTPETQFTSKDTASSPGDTVSISSKAADYNETSNYYGRFFPARDGMNTDALLNGILHPGSTSSSQGKTFPDVAEDARKRMDEKYAQMKDGPAFDTNSLKDYYSLMGDLDRRSLYAVSSNEGGLFTDEEQAAATYIMRQQQSLATGIYSGPPELEKDYTPPFANDTLSQIKAGLDFLDSASDEEKQSSDWQKQRTGLLKALQTATQAPPVTDTDETSDSKQPQRQFILAELMAQWDSNSSESKDFNSDEQAKKLSEKITNGKMT